MTLITKTTPVTERWILPSPIDPVLDPDLAPYVMDGKIWAKAITGSPYLSYLRVNGAWVQMGGPEAYTQVNFPAAYSWFDAKQLTLGDGVGMGGTWTDLTGQGHSITQPTTSAQPIYKAADLDSHPYVLFADGTKSATIPLPSPPYTINILASGTGSIAFDGSNHILSSLLKFSDNDAVAVSGNAQWFFYKQSGGFGTAGAGYSGTYTFVTLRVNSTSSADLLVNGNLTASFTPNDAMTYSTVTLGPAAGKVRLLNIFPSALSLADIANHSRWALRYYNLTWLEDWNNSLATPALIIRKSGLQDIRPLIMMQHPAGYNERYFRDAATFYPVVSALVEAGYIVASSRLTDNPATGHGSWGNQASLNANAELYTYLTGNYPVDTSKVALIGASMGGLSSLLAFPDGRIPAKGAALYDPVCSLSHAYTDNGNLFKAAIDDAYGITGTPPNDYATATAGHDPYLRSATDWANKRLRFYGGSGDTVLVWANQGQAMSTKETGTALEAGIVTLPGDHLANADTTVNDLLSFIGRCFS